MSSVAMTPWQSSPVDFTLEPGDVHLWRFRLSGAPPEGLLDPAEILRAERLRIPEKARAFVVARSRLRQILACYLNMNPMDIQFEYNEHGKPFLRDGDLQFNLSHSGNWALCAVSSQWDVGVDLEQVRDELDYAKLADRFFSRTENSWLKTSPEVRRSRNFFRLWTRKEAWLKGKGGGFSELNLELAAAHISGRSGCADNWWVANIAVTRGYVGAIAVAGDIEKVERWSWRE